MNAARFHNMLRTMWNLDTDALHNAGVIDGNWGTPEASERDQLGAFLLSPHTEALRMPDANFERLYALIESQQPKERTR